MAQAAPDAMAGAALLRGVALEVANTVLVSFALTEVLLRQRRVRDVHFLLLALGSINLLLSPRVHAFVGAAAAAMAPAGAGPGPEAGEAMPAPEALPAAGAAATTAPPAAEALGAAAAAASAFGLPPVLQGVLRFLSVAAGFAAIAYVDIRRLRRQPYGLATYARELWAAMCLVLPVFPFLIMGFSCAFMIVVSVFTKLGLPQHLGEELIVYGQFYAPLSAVYWIIKKDWLATDRATPVLPVAKDGGAALHRRDFE